MYVIYLPPPNSYTLSFVVLFSCVFGLPKFFKCKITVRTWPEMLMHFLF